MPRRREPGPPDGPTPEPTRDAIDRCRRCELWQPATQGVNGEGSPAATIVLVGEQPGNDEDLAGRPFVGPAGRLLRELLERAGIADAEIFLTNAVKHFYFELRGKRRIHKTPLQRHVAACHVWLEAELEKVRPRVIVTLGATALAAVLGRRLSIAEAREASLLHEPTGTPVLATYHPSAVLRVPDPTAREALRNQLLGDLRRARTLASRRRRK
ncbi:MAG TPA: UdgX family uracil-DNA binding protein [Steroidobacteraceae bacterium]|nr:UdgX family uracil-DNA binding protein [Steroidobacteraceae bacterium]